MNFVDQILQMRNPAYARTTLPELLSLGGSVWDPTAYFDSEAGSIGQPQVGPGWMSGLAYLPGQEFLDSTAIEGQFDSRAFQQYMRDRGFTAAEASLGGNRYLRGVFDASGNPVVPTEEFVYDGDRAFWNAALTAAAVTGGNIGLSNGLFGGTTVASAGSASSLPGIAGGGFMDASTFAGLGGVGGAGGYTVPSLSSLAPAAATGTPSLSLGGLARGINAGLNIFGGLYGMRQADKAAERMDPFGPYRARYAQMLQDLEANPGSIVSRPGFRAGLKALESSTAAGGYFGSGNAAAALTEFGGNFYDRERNFLAQLAGAGVQPGAGSLGALDVTGRSMAGIGYGIGQLAELFGG